MTSAKRTAMKNSFINSFFALVFSLLLGMIFIGISGYSPLESYKAIFGVSLGTVKGFALSLRQATPIMFTGLLILSIIGFIYLMYVLVKPEKF